jgi:hypothetical protein
MTENVFAARAETVPWIHKVAGLLAVSRLSAPTPRLTP